MAKSTKSPQEQKVERSKAKSAKFLELASKRMTRALKAIEVIGNLANRNSYTYDDAQSNKMVAALAEAVKAVQQKFAAPAGKSGPSGFTF